MGNPIQHQMRPTIPFIGTPTVATIAGISWRVPWELPQFKKEAKAYLAQTEARTLTPSTLPVGIAGSAFFKPWEPPHFPKKFPAQLQQTQLQTLTTFQTAVVSGIAWRYPFDQPFPKKTKVEIQQTSMFVVSPRTLPVGIAGISWRVAWELPYYKKFPAQLQDTELVLLIGPQAVAPPYFWYPFDQPKQVKVSATIQMTTLQNRRPSPAEFARGYIIGPA